MPVGSTLAALSQILTLLSKKTKLTYAEIPHATGTFKKRKDTVKFLHFSSLKLCRMSPALYFFLRPTSESQRERPYSLFFRRFCLHKRRESGGNLLPPQFLACVVM